MRSAALAGAAVAFSEQSPRDKAETVFLYWCFLHFAVAFPAFPSFQSSSENGQSGTVSFWKWNVSRKGILVKSKNVAGFNGLWYLDSGSFLFASARVRVLVCKGRY